MKLEGQQTPKQADCYVGYFLGVLARGFEGDEQVAIYDDDAWKVICEA